MVATLGLLEPARAAALDPLIADYTAAECLIGFCPGPGPHLNKCVRNERGTFSCGGL